MFGNKTVAEWNADTEKLRSEIAQVKHQQVKRGLTREKQKLKLEDIEDKLLSVQVRSRENAVAIAEAKLEGEKVLLSDEVNKTKYLKARSQLTLKGYGIDLEIQATELAGSQEKLRSLREVAKTLNHKLANNPAAQLGIGGQS